MLTDRGRATQMALAVGGGPSPAIAVIPTPDRPACWECGARRRLFVIWYYHPGGTSLSGHAFPCLLHSRAVCLDATICSARRAKQLARASARSGPLYLYDPPCADPPEGACQWCGAPIVLADPTDYRRRQRTVHYGDEHELGEHKCRADRNASIVWKARAAIRIVAKRDGRVALACVDCGIVVEELDDDGRWVGLQERRVEVPFTESERAAADVHAFGELPAGPVVRYVATGVPPWEADHEIPLEDGGAHTMANLRCRCVPCHNAKTAREARDRSRRSRPVAATLSAPHRDTRTSA